MKIKMRNVVLGAAGGLLLLAQQSAFAVPTVISPGDDDSVQVTLGFTFGFQGVNYNDVWINSNGNLTFGGGDTDFSESTSEFLSQEPRIAGAWDDLRPPGGGTIQYEGDSSSMLIEFIGIPEFFATGSNTFSFELFSSGAIELVFGEMSLTDGIVGISPGGGLLPDPGEVDFSEGPLVYGNTGVIYEQFSAGQFDLSGLTLRFEPQSVPEPGTLALLGLGLAGMGFARRKKA